MNDEKIIAKKETLELTDRKHLVIKGTKEIGSFNEEEVVVCFEESELCVRGVGLHINKIDVDRGELDLIGEEITALIYSNEVASGEGIFRRLFK